MEKSPDLAKERVGSQPLLLLWEKCDSDGHKCGKSVG
jgi:hypothetical protein